MLLLSNYYCFFLQAKSNAQKGTQRKKWRKSTIVLVSDPPPSVQPDNSEAVKKENNTITEANDSKNIPQKIHSYRPENASVVPKAENNFIETDIPLKIPRAMRKQVPSNGGVPFGDRNAGSKPEESVNKEHEVFDARSPVRQKRTLEKENSGR